MSKIFKAYDGKPSQTDFVDQIDLIAEAVKRDGKLAKSKVSKENRKPSENDFIVEDASSVASTEDELDDDDFFESVCAICDNGGELLCCKGSCLRSFHATKNDGEDSLCDSLGMTEMQVEAIQEYYCPNCEHKIHSCFICKKLGSSDNSTGKAEVFQCVSATCGYFYHPRCVTKRLGLGDNAEAEALESQIFAGEFICPLHKCSVCKNGEDTTDSNLQFAICRRCPKSYHRKCLPREISFEDIQDENILTSAWDGLLNNRVLMYCQDHEIDEELMTPVRDHVKFPLTEEKKIFTTEKRKVLESQVGRDKARPTVKNLLRKRKEVDSFRNVVPNKSQKMMEYGESREAGKKKVELNEAREAGKNKVEVKEALKADKSKALLGERLYYRHEPNIVKPGRKKTDSISSKEPPSEFLTLNTDSQKRLLAIMEKAKQEITMVTILKKYQGPSTYRSSTMNAVSKTITMGKVEGSVQAARTALKKLEEGGSIEDAKAVCEPQQLSQIFEWKAKLNRYLAPFIHGARYNSYGRCFTKVGKLQQIVDRLHWYAEDGDMFVDFCCGANDLSCLMKAKLEETGKKCSYKNYDIFQAKNDFCFEKRDWLTVCKEELLPGRKLIMGLSPPFGWTNVFVTKALEFLPKILILILPTKTERLDKKEPSYVRIWEDEEIISVKSFYLPGSVNNEESWNLVSPPLSLWSHPDFAAKHKEIAEMHNHLSRDVGSLQSKEIDEEANASLHPPPFANGPRLENEDMRNWPTSSVRSSGEDIYTVRPSPANTGQKPYEALKQSYFDDGLFVKYVLSGGYRMPGPPLIPDQFPLAPSPRKGPNEMFDYQRYSGLNRGVGPKEMFDYRRYSGLIRGVEHGASLSHFDDGLFAKYGLSGDYRMPDPPLIPDQFPLAPFPRNSPNEMFDYRRYSGLNRVVGPEEYPQQYGGHLDPMLAPPPPSLMAFSGNSHTTNRRRWDEFNGVCPWPELPLYY